MGDPFYRVYDDGKDGLAYMTGSKSIMNPISRAHRNISTSA